MSVDRLRTAMMLSLAKDGWPDDVAGPVALAVHPFDDAPVPSRSYEKAVRPLARAFAKELGRWPNGDAEGAKRRAVALLAQYRALANAHRESPHFVHRFDQTLLRAQAVAPERPSNKAAAPATPGRLEELSSEWVSLQQQWLELTGQPLPKVDVMTPAEPMSIHQTERVLERLGQLSLGQRSLGQAEAIAKWEAKVAAFRSQLADAIAPRPAAGAAPPVAGRIAELKELAALLEAGHITESEFDQLKQDVLTAKHLAPSSPTPAVPPVTAAPSEAATLQRSPVLPSAPLQVPGVPASHFQPAPAGNGAGQFSTEFGVGSALRSGVGLTAALGWTTTVAAVGGSIAAAVEYRQAFRQWAETRGRSRVETLVQAEDALEAWSIGMRSVGALALLFTIIWLYQVAKRVPDGPTPGSMIWSWFIPAANFVLVPLELSRLSDRCTRRSTGKTMREAAAWAAPAGVIAAGIANVFAAENYPTAGISTPRDQLDAYFNATIWLAVASTITPLALAIFTWSLRRVGSANN